jgi:hypothetical protein
MDQDDVFHKHSDIPNVEFPAPRSSRLAIYVLAVAAGVVLALGVAFLVTATAFGTTTALVCLTAALTPVVWRWTKKNYSASIALAKESQSPERILAICAKCNSATTMPITCEKCFRRTWNPGHTTDGSSGWFCSSCKQGVTSFTCRKCNHQNPVIVKNFGWFGPHATNVFVAGRGTSDEIMCERHQKGLGCIGGLWLIIAMFIFAILVLIAIAR